MTQTNKPIIEAIINTAALAIAASGVVMIQAKEVFGFVLILFALGIEWFKYWGRKENFW